MVYIYVMNDILRWCTCMTHMYITYIYEIQSLQVEVDLRHVTQSLWVGVGLCHVTQSPWSGVDPIHRVPLNAKLVGDQWASGCPIVGEILKLLPSDHRLILTLADHVHITLHRQFGRIMGPQWCQPTAAIIMLSILICYIIDDITSDVTD